MNSSKNGLLNCLTKITPHSNPDYKLQYTHSSYTHSSPSTLHGFSHYEVFSNHDGKSEGEIIIDSSKANIFSGDNLVFELSNSFIGTVSNTDTYKCINCKNDIVTFDYTYSDSNEYYLLSKEKFNSFSDTIEVIDQNNEHYFIAVNLVTYNNDVSTIQTSDL